VMGQPIPADRYGFVPDAKVIGAVLDGKRAVAIGPGIPKGKGTVRFILDLMHAFDGTVVLDADALNLVAGHDKDVKAARCRKVFTPHPGEMARLLKTTTAAVQDDRLGAAADCARRYGAVTILKGAATVVAGTEGNATINATGNPGMASGGTGDVLTGITGAFVAGGLDSYNAARAAAYIHGLAADRAAVQKGMTALNASDIIDGLPAIFAEWEL